MTAVNGLAAASNNPVPTAAPKIASADYDTFLQLMMTQLRTQDPTNPMDSAQFMAQLATFTQVEQSMLANSKLDSLLTASALSQAESMIGRTVTSGDGKISGEISAVKITSDGPLATLKNGKELLLGSGVTIS